MKKALDRFDVGEFFEIFVNTPLEVCELRDAKGLMPEQGPES
jgi:adenylylsulfate kinase-like enzyme